MWITFPEILQNRVPRAMLNPAFLERAFCLKGTREEWWKNKGFCIL